MKGSRFTGVALVVVATVVLVAMTGTVAAQNIAVDVTVVDQEGNPVEGVELTATWEGGETTTETLAGGGALFQVPEGADVTVAVDHPDYVRNRPFQIRNATVPENQTRLTVEIPVALSGTADITVEDDDGPVEDASVELRDGVAIESLTTDGNGAAQTRRIEHGEYRLIVEKPGYLRESLSLTVDGDVSRTVAIERGSVNVQFNVTDDHFDPPQPIEEARIEVDGDSFSTRDTGLRSTDLPVNREYEVTVTKEGYESETRTLSVEESDVAFNVSIQRTPALDVQSSNQRVVVDETTRITVTDEYGNPVTGATVSLDGEDVAETGEDGTAEVQVTSEGEQEISVNADGLVSSITIEGIAPGEADDSADGEEEPADDEDETDDDSADDEEEPADDSGPGFGVLVGLVAVLAVATLARRR